MMMKTSIFYVPSMTVLKSTDSLGVLTNTFRATSKLYLAPYFSHRDLKLQCLIKCGPT